MPVPGENFTRFKPRSVSDAVDGDNVLDGAMASLANLILDPSTPNIFQCRPANSNLNSFVGFSSPGIVSAALQVNGIVYGLVASALNSGKDQPFAYNISSNTFETVNGITSANSPTTPANTGDWVPPMMEAIGSKIFVTHPGFNFAGGYAFGFFDISGFTASPTGNTSNVSNQNIITSVSSLAGVEPGYTISGSGIPANTVILSIDKTANTIKMSANATATASGVNLTIAGGTATTPLWCAGNTGGTGLASIALAVKGFNNRAYLASANNLVLTDTLSTYVTNTNGVQVLTIGDNTNITALMGLPFYSTTGGTIQALVVFKNFSIWQVTGDPTTNNLTVNQLSGSVGTQAPRTVCATPEGIRFMAVDGVRKINLIGEVSDPNRDLALPFIYALTPSRAAASFNSGVYRICVQNGNALNNPYQDYYYYLAEEVWTGPHNFRIDLATPYNNDFIVFNNSASAKIWQSFAVQNHNSQGNTFVENGTQMTWSFATQPMTELGAPLTKTAIRSTIDMALPATGDTYLFTAIDNVDGTVAQAEIMALTQEAIWNAFNWGDGTLWGAGQFGLAPYEIPWSQPPIFNELAISASGNSSLGLKLGSIYNGYKQLGYLKQ